MGSYSLLLAAFIIAVLSPLAVMASSGHVEKDSQATVLTLFNFTTSREVTLSSYEKMTPAEGMAYIPPVREIQEEYIRMIGDGLQPYEAVLITQLAVYETVKEQISQ